MALFIVSRGKNIQTKRIFVGFKCHQTQLLKKVNS